MQNIKHDICNCVNRPELKLVKQLYTLNDLRLYTDRQADLIKYFFEEEIDIDDTFESGVFICENPTSEGVSYASEPIISLEDKHSYARDIEGREHEYACLLSELISEIKNYHQEFFSGKSIKIIGVFCMGNISPGIDQLSEMMKNFAPSGLMPVTYRSVPQDPGTGPQFYTEGGLSFMYVPSENSTFVWEEEKQEWIPQVG